MLKRILINRHKIRSNRVHNRNEPVISVREGKQIKYGHKVCLLNEQGNIVAHIIYRPDKPLSCGATVWIETKLDVIVPNQENANVE